MFTSKNTIGWLSLFLFSAIANAGVTYDYVQGGNIRLSGNSVVSQNTNGNVDCNPNGSGKCTLSDETASRAVVLDSNKGLTSSATTATQIGHLSAVASAVCGKDDSCTLTTKTIDGDNNTVQDLAIGSLKTDAGNASKIIGRDGSGVPTNLSAANATSYLNAFVGDSGSGGTKGLVPAPSSGDAAANKFLSADGTFKVTPASGVSTVTKTTTYTATTSDSVIYADATSAAFPITLPVASGASGLILTIKKIDSTFNLVTIDGNGSETIDGALTKKLATQYQSYTIYCDGSSWKVREVYVYGGRQTYSPTVSGLGTGSATVNLAEWSRSDRFMDIAIKVTKDANAGTGGTGVTINLPSGVTIASNYFPTTGYIAAGYSRGIEASAQSHPLVVNATASGTSFGFLDNGSNGSNYSGADFRASSELGFAIRVPIENWDL
jgi:hypothetical protein